MLKKLSSITIYIAILFQTLFAKESNVIIANIISTVVIFPYMLCLFSTKRFEINFPILMYIILSFFWLASTLWHPEGSSFNYFKLKNIFVVCGFLIIFYTLIKRQNCFDSVRWAFISCIFVNFVLFAINLDNSLFGEIYIQKRFVGSFVNANQASVVFFSGIIFSFYDLTKSNKLLKFIAITCIFCSIILILATASKKGVILVAFTLICFAPFYFKNFNLKEIISALLLMIISATIVFSFRDQLNLEHYWHRVTYRFEKFHSEIFQTQNKNIVGKINSESSTSHRQSLINFGLNKFWESPILGHGAYAFSHYKKTYAHNNYIELLFNGGLIAFTIYYSIYLWVLIKATKLKDKHFQKLVIFPIFAILLMDVASVSYNNKFTLYIIFACASIVGLKYADQKLQESPTLVLNNIYGKKKENSIC